MNFKGFLYKYLWWTYRPIKSVILKWQYDKKMKNEADRLLSMSNGEKRIFYLGITAHVNLGDLAQHYCILEWIKNNYPDYILEKFEADPIVYRKYKFLERFATIYGPQDIIVFQSGYTTQDLGGYHNLMHEMIVKALPEAKILMLPQTIFFREEKNKQHTAHILNSAQNMLFLARDMVSFEIAKQMMPNVRVQAYPDIVTTLIGELKYNNKREGICLCTRNDGEKFYSKDQIDSLAKRFVAHGISVKLKDTQSHASLSEIRSNLQKHIETEIESYSYFKVTITDRYHGTIFSLCAGTPVIIIKTTDHKVTTGADWFKGVYDNYIYVAEDLEDAFRKAQVLLSMNLENYLTPYFKTNYYDKLKDIFEQT